jgi:hypothetical protein
MIEKIISGGQTGADRAALDVAIKLWSGNQDLMTSCCFFAKKESLHEDEACSIIIRELWKRLRKTHKLRIIE